MSGAIRDLAAQQMRVQVDVARVPAMDQPLKEQSEFRKHRHRLALFDAADRVAGVEGLVGVKILGQL